MVVSSEVVLNKNREHRLDVVETDVLMLRVELERVGWRGLEWMLARHQRNSAKLPKVPRALKLGESEQKSTF